MTVIRKAVIISCDNHYVPKAIVALRQFETHNPDYDRYIIATKLTQPMLQLCHDYQIQVKLIDLRGDFINLDQRPYGRQYPVECFYHLYAYQVLDEYDYLVQIEPDMYTNQPLNDSYLKQTSYIGGGFDSNQLISKYSPIMRDYAKIAKQFGSGQINLPRILGGSKIYNVKNLKKINFYQQIVRLYQQSWQIAAPRCGDDSLMVLYQLLHSEQVKLFDVNYMVTYHINNSQFNQSKAINRLDQITFYHFTGPNQKYWDQPEKVRQNYFERFYTNQMVEFLYNHFPPSYIQQYLPSLYSTAKPPKTVNLSKVEPNQSTKQATLSTVKPNLSTKWTIRAAIKPNIVANRPVPTNPIKFDR